ncbi:hypothetical protein J1770_gp12 [Gordonia phage EMoore]|uniref:Uncharacterized protein n=1 Tax=Gordonia phage EMoore TaxID=2656534 RepID=A0A649VU20_9CAUD|nr:hypothetical protein J1770_gp12 [Gordonia phage EMoore]QGJ95798.1 hypothetical protein SEA_EMOORE_12 [Gordonia phage EMoore]
MSDDIVHVGELVGVEPVEPRTVLPGEPRCDVETVGVRQFGRLRMSLRTQCELPPDHACDHRVTMPDGDEFRW